MSPSQTPLDRALLSLDGLSVGDGFGQSFFFVTPVIAESRLQDRFTPPPPWFFTDDTVMSVSIVRSLAKNNRVDPAWLATGGWQPESSDWPDDTKNSRLCYQHNTNITKKPDQLQFSACFPLDSRLRLQVWSGVVLSI